MKTIILALFSLVMGANLVCAQGTIQFFGAAAGVMTNTSYYYAPHGGFSATGKTFSQSLAPGAYNFILLAATSINASDEGNPLGPDWSAVSIYGGALAVASNSIIAGSVAGPGGNFGFSSSLTAGTTYDIMLVGWSSNLGDWDQIQVDYSPRFENVYLPAFTFFGISPIGTVTPNPLEEPMIPGAPVFGPGIPNNSTVLYIVGGPEPSTLALAGLGGLFMLCLRRRKS
jgi:hypothetical protein